MLLDLGGGGGGGGGNPPNCYIRGSEAQSRKFHVLLLHLLLFPLGIGAFNSC